MFKCGGLLRNRIISDEAFTVVTGRDVLEDQEGNRRMSIAAEREPGGFSVAEDTIGRWDDNPSRPSLKDKCRIANNIRRALERRGCRVSQF